MTIDQMKESCEIFSLNGLGNEFFEADHDVIFGPSMEVIRDKISLQGIAALEKLGWHDSSEYDCFACFV